MFNDEAEWYIKDIEDDKTLNVLTLIFEFYNFKTIGNKFKRFPILILKAKYASLIQVVSYKKEYEKVLKKHNFKEIFIEDILKL